MSLTALLRDDLFTVFEYVAKCRRVQFIDLRRDLKLDAYVALQRLNELADAGLIKWRDAPSNILDFRHYYISAEGLQVERELGLNHTKGGVMDRGLLNLVVTIFVILLVFVLILKLLAYL